MAMKFETMDAIKEADFLGFRKIGDLMVNPSSIPKERGVYLILYTGTSTPEFLAKGTGGFFKGKNPNISIEELSTKWVSGTPVIYIGQAGGIQNDKWSESTLFNRISLYMKFGKGQKVGHYGGRLIWQIKDSRELLVCWKALPHKLKDPKELEGELIQQFKGVFGKRPFANLQD